MRKPVHPSPSPRLAVRGGARRGGGGFTLVELLVTVAVGGALLAVGIPAYQGMMAVRGVGNTADELADVLRLARSEAMKRGNPVSICSIANPNVSNPVCATSATWATGWVMFSDMENNGTISANDPIIKVYTPSSTIGSLTETSNKLYVSFLPNGISGKGVPVFTIRPKGTTSSPYYDSASRKVCLSQSGRVSVIAVSATC